ncbi:MAG: 30S ribosomal protein S1 [Pirellulales bacterium]
MSTDPAQNPSSESTDAPSTETPAAAAPTSDAGPAASEATPSESSDDSGKPKVKIGSQRSDEEVRKSKGLPELDIPEEDPNKLGVDSSGKVEVPSLRDTMEDIEAEVEAALGGMSLDSVIAEEDATTLAGTRLEQDSRVPANVVRVHRKEIFFDLPGHNQGVASGRNFTELPEVGTKMEVVVNDYNPAQGLYEVVIPGSSVSVVDWGDLKEGILVDVVIDGVNKGGLECAIGQVRGFIPASQVAQHHVEKMDEYLGKRMQCLVTEANPERRNLVLSARAVLEKAREDSRKETLGTVAIGQLREGVVTKLMDFGAFVDIGGVDGMVHVSQIGWERVNHPSDALQEGQAVKVKVTKFDSDTGKIGLSIRDTMENPFDKAAEEFAVGAIIKGKVTKIMDFGAFVEIAPGIEGLVHISEVSHNRVTRVQSVVSEGQDVDVKVVNIDKEKRRIGLSIKATMQAPVDKSGKGKKDEYNIDADRELQVKKHEGDLKGGTGTDRSDGSKFGLKW